MRITVMTRPPATPSMARGLGALARRAVREASSGRGQAPPLRGERTRNGTDVRVRSTTTNPGSWPGRSYEVRAKAIEIALMGDGAIRALNRRFHHADRPTDVLAFDLGETLNVAVSVDRARIQAREFGHSLRTELGHLVTHGILHLAGWRDDSPSRLARMNARTESLLKEARWPSS